MSESYKDYLSAYKEKYSRPEGTGVPRFYMLGERVGGGFIPLDHSGFIISRDEWLTMTKVAEHFYDTTTDDQINEFNDERTDELNEEVRGHIRKPKPLVAGYIYFLKADNGLIKIGRTKDLDKRLDHFTTKLPYKLELIHSIKTSDYVGLEESFHDKYKANRKRGEWFDLDDSDIEDIRGYADE